MRLVGVHRGFIRFGKACVDGNNEQHLWGKVILRWGKDNGYAVKLVCMCVCFNPTRRSFPPLSPFCICSSAFHCFPFSLLIFHFLFSSLRPHLLSLPALPLQHLCCLCVLLSIYRCVDFNVCVCLSLSLHCVCVRARALVHVCLCVFLPQSAVCCQVTMETKQFSPCLGWSSSCRVGAFHCVCVCVCIS